MAMPFLKYDRTDKEVTDEIKDLVRRFGLHSGWHILGSRCCTPEELDDAVMHEVRGRRERNTTSMIVTTGQSACAAGVFLPPAPKAE